MAQKALKTFDKHETMGSRGSAPRSPRKKKTSGGKKTVAKAQTPRRSAPQVPPEEGTEGIPMSNEVTIIVAVGLTILMMLSNFNLCGEVGKILKSFFFGVFGFSQYAMPIVLCVIVFMLIANDYSVLSIKKSGALFIIMMVISGIAQLFTAPEGYALEEIFGDSAADPHLGGIIAGGFTEILRRGFGIPGAVIILLCLLILAVVMLTQKSVVEFFRNTYTVIRTKYQMWQDKIQEKKRQREEAYYASLEEGDAAGYYEDTPEPVTESKTSDREKKLEDKVKEIEKEINDTRSRETEAKKEKTKRKEPVNIPVFVSSDGVKNRDSVEELHAHVYPFDEEDGKTDPFTGELDYSAFDTGNGRGIAVKPVAPAMAGNVFRSVEEILPEATVPEVSIPEVSIPEVSMPETSVPETSVPETDSFQDDVNAFHIMEEEPPVNDMDPETAMIMGKTPVSSEEKRGKPAKKEKTGDKDQITIDRAAAPRPLAEGTVPASSDYLFPPVTLLTAGSKETGEEMDAELKETAMKLQQTLRSFGVNVKITNISCGPSVTRYELFPEQGVKVSKIVSLTDDIKLNLAAADIRIEAPIPGKAAIGIEVPNKKVQTVYFRDLIDNRTFRNMKSKLAFAAGKDIGGKIVMADLAKMPHMLVAGTTGSGKSVFINTIIMSIIYKATPEEVRFIMVDPKMVELNVYNGIPHLLIPVVTDPKKASGALNWAVSEMTDRYRKFAETGTRNLSGYNKKVDALIRSGEVSEEKLSKLPQIVIIIDELADLMMVAKSEVEDAIVRLSQLARAAGIHMVIATQRPSVDVITGLIKANVPSRVALSVSSGTDSRTIIDMNGAEKLLGNGDMLFYPSGYQKPVRVQSALITDEDIIKITDFLRGNARIKQAYDKKVTEKIEKNIKTETVSQDRDEYFEAAARFIMEKDKATIGMLQRMFKIGFNRAARIIDQLAEAGIVGPEEGTKPRKILMSPEELEDYLSANS